MFLLFSFSLQEMLIINISPYLYIFLLLCPTIESKTITTTITQTIPAPSPHPTKVSASYTSDSDFRSTILNSTNFYRNEHNATVLKWNESLAIYATAHASRCKWEHSAGPFGENLAESYPNITSAVEAWGNERSKYDFGRPTGFSEKTGHFTQLVWKATRTVGCGRVDCGAQASGDKEAAFGWLVVCEYWPPGNVETQYKAQVQKKQTKKGRKHENNSAGMKKVGPGAVVAMAIMMLQLFANEMMGVGGLISGE